MPGGRTHDAITGIMAPVAFAIGGVWQGWLGGCLFMLAHLFSGWMLSPDLDVVAGCCAYKRWGPFKIIWRPYMRVFRHRSGITHGPIIGSLFRLAYLGLVVAIAYTLFLIGTALLWRIMGWRGVDEVMESINSTHGFVWAAENWKVVLLAVCGLEFGAICHIVADKTMKNKEKS